MAVQGRAILGVCFSKSRKIIGIFKLCKIMSAAVKEVGKSVGFTAIVLYFAKLLRRFSLNLRNYDRKILSNM